MNKILVVDDDRDLCLLLEKYLSRKGYEVTTAPGMKKALEMLDLVQPDLMLSDFRFEDGTGMELLQQLRQRNNFIPVIIITGYSDIKIAVEIMKLGAYDYVTKPLFPDEILETIKRALSAPTQSHVPVAGKQAGPQPEVPKSGPVRTFTPEENGQYVFGDSPAFQSILRQVALVAPTNYSVILYGESGSGKEVIAQQIHNLSTRAGKPFVAIDCGALSKELASSEMFGHVKGSFTGALNDKVGSFEIANGGTIFLDEIANLSYDVQVSLLRVVQERKMRRVGGNKDIDLDVRIIVASNEKLLEAARKGKFREDLYHRFNEFSIDIPALRDRKEDILFFAKYFLQQTNAELGKNIRGFSKEVEEIFKNYVWYGNLRELKNVIKRATLLSEGDLVDSRSLPFEISNYSKLLFDVASNEAPAHQAHYQPQAPSYTPEPVAHTSTTAPMAKAGSPEELNLKHASIDAEYELIVQALKKANFNKTKAAQLLNIDRKTLYNKMRQYQEWSNL